MPFWVLESCVVHAQLVTLSDVDDPIVTFTALAQAEFSENMACRGILYAYPGVPVSYCNKHIPFDYAAHYRLKVVVELVLHTTVGREHWSADRNHDKIGMLALQAHHSSS